MMNNNLERFILLLLDDCILEKDKFREFVEFSGDRNKINQIILDSGPFFGGFLDMYLYFGKDVCLKYNYETLKSMYKVLGGVKTKNFMEKLKLVLERFNRASGYDPHFLTLNGHFAMNHDLVRKPEIEKYYITKTNPQIIKEIMKIFNLQELVDQEVVGKEILEILFKKGNLSVDYSKSGYYIIDKINK